MADSGIAKIAEIANIAKIESQKPRSCEFTRTSADRDLPQRTQRAQRNGNAPREPERNFVQGNDGLWHSAQLPRLPQFETRTTMNRADQVFNFGDFGNCG
jgi:hypothetical protein